MSAWRCLAVVVAAATVRSAYGAAIGGATFQYTDSIGKTQYVPAPYDVMQPNQVNCPGVAGAERFDYFVFGGESNGIQYGDAKFFCEDDYNGVGFEGAVASVGCAAEKDYIHGLVQRYMSLGGGQDLYYWLGAIRKTGAAGVPNRDDAWKWEDGSMPFNSVFDGNPSWSPGEPNAKQSKEKNLLGRPDGNWNDAKGTKVQNVVAVCKRPYRPLPTYTQPPLVTQTTTKTVTQPPKTTVTKTTAARPTPEDFGWSCRDTVYKADDTTAPLPLRCCYQYFNRVVDKVLVPGFERQTWAGSANRCMKSVATSRYKKYGVNLASIQSKAEDEFVQDVIYKKSRDLLNRPVWIGGIKNKKTGTWGWPEKFKVWSKQWTGYTNWRAGEPNDKDGSENCMQMNHARSTSSVNRRRNKNPVDGWNDADCNKKRGYVCEFCWDPAQRTP